MASQQLESASWHSAGQQFTSSHNDGSYIIWNVKSNPADAADTAADAADVDADADVKTEPLACTPYGPFPCKAINKILWNADEVYVQLPNHIVQ